jgi:mono/diheme cytochrome c family protein
MARATTSRLDRDQCVAVPGGARNGIAGSDGQRPMTHHHYGTNRVLLFCTPLLTATLLVAATPKVGAQDIGDVGAGRHLAQTWCASCHVVDPAATRGVDNGAPAFTAIARMPSTTPLSLHAFLQTPHARMPDLHLSRNEIDDLAGYILSLRQE